MSDRYFWTKDHNVLVIHSGNNIFKNDENLLELNDTEVRLHLNPPKPPTTMDQVNKSMQSLTDSTARVPENGGFKDMSDAYAWASLHQDPQAINLVAWDKSCWDLVDALGDTPPIDLIAFMDSLPKF